MDKLDTLVIGEHVNLLQGHDAFRAGRYADAAAAFAKALEVDPDSCEAAVNLATALAMGGQAAKAVEQLRTTAVKCPDNPTARYDLGHLLLQQGSYVEARAALEAALELQPRDLDAHMELASALRSLGDLPGAIEHLRLVVKHNPASEEAQYRLAAALVGAGRYQEARTALDDALQVLPTAGRLAHALARLLAAAPDPQVRDGARALDLAQRVYAAQRTVSHGQTLAMALAETGQCEAAAKLEGKVIEALETAGDTAPLPALRAEQQYYAAGPPCRAPLAGQLPNP
jgi:tetratricopeptide (TPR) repeat protein